MESLSVEVRTSRVRLRQGLSAFASKGKLLNADDCYKWVRTRRNLVGWTYNYNAWANLLGCFQKLISCQGTATSRVRIANNTHMKCYISTKSMLVTSFNLTKPTVNDLGFEIQDVVLCNYMRRIFNKHWKELE